MYVYVYYYYYCVHRNRETPFREHDPPPREQFFFCKKDTMTPGKLTYTNSNRVETTEENAELLSR